MAVLRDVRYNQDLAVSRSRMAPGSGGGRGGGGGAAPTPMPQAPGAIGRSSPTLRGLTFEGGDGRDERSQRGGDFMAINSRSASPEQAYAINQALSSPLGKIGTGLAFAVNPVLGLGVLGLKAVTGMAGNGGASTPDVYGEQQEFNEALDRFRSRSSNDATGGDGRDSGGFAEGSSFGDTRGAGNMGGFGGLYRHGGPVAQTGQAQVHKGEFVLSPEAVRGAGGPAKLGDIMDRLEAHDRARRGRRAR